MAIIVFQHDEVGRPGRLGATLRDHAHRLDIRMLHRGDPVPPDLDNVHGVISMGGRQNVDEPSADAGWMDDEIAFLRAAHDRQLPILGVCLGAQLLAHALGGEVGPMEQPEIGFHTVTIGPAGHTDTVLAGVAWDHPQFCHHTREIKSLPPGATALASSRKCAIQVFRAGLRSYGFQHHFEADRDLIMELIGRDKSDLHRAGYTEQEIEQQIEKHYPAFARLSDRLCVNIASYLMPTGKYVTA